jgi:histidinol-phosphate phosphatase family protein
MSGPDRVRVPGDRRPAVFLDRDGTLTEERVYAATPDEIVLLPGAGAAVSALNESAVAAVLITNQSGVGRGLFTLGDLHAQHERLEALLRAEGAHLDGIYFCPHHPDAKCRCRKPGPGLLESAARELGLDLARSFVIGDRADDTLLGERFTAGGLLVLTGYGRDMLVEGEVVEGRVKVFPEVHAAVRHALARIGAG